MSPEAHLAVVAQFMRVLERHDLRGPGGDPLGQTNRMVIAQDLLESVESTHLEPCERFENVCDTAIELLRALPLVLHGGGAEANRLRAALIEAGYIAVSPYVESAVVPDFSTIVLPVDPTKTADPVSEAPWTPITSQQLHDANPEGPQG